MAFNTYIMSPMPTTIRQAKAEFKYLKKEFDNFGWRWDIPKFSKVEDVLEPLLNARMKIYDLRLSYVRRFDNRIS